MTCEYRTRQEGVQQEVLTLVTRGRKDKSVKVKLQAKVIGRSLTLASQFASTYLCLTSSLVFLRPTSRDSHAAGRGEVSGCHRAKEEVIQASVLPNASVFPGFIRWF